MPDIKHGIPESHFCTFVLVLLSHSVYAYSGFPTAALSEMILKIVVECSQVEVQGFFRQHISKFPLLISFANPGGRGSAGPRRNYYRLQF